MANSPSPLLQISWLRLIALVLRLRERQLPRPDHLEIVVRRRPSAPRARLQPTVPGARVDSRHSRTRKVVFQPAGNDERITWDVPTTLTITRDQRLGHDPPQDLARENSDREWRRICNKKDSGIRTECCRRIGLALIPPIHQKAAEARHRKPMPYK